MKELIELIEEKQLFPQRFLVCDEKEHLIYSSSDKNLKNLQLTYTKFNILKSNQFSHNRGKLLGDILLIEYFISQIIFLKLLNGEIVFFDYPKIKHWNDFLDDFTFNNKIKLLLTWGFINSKEKRIFDNIRRFRNELAHSLAGSYFEYNKNPLKESFCDFEKDFYLILNTLIEINSKLWREQDLVEKTKNYINNLKS